MRSTVWIDQKQAGPPIDYFGVPHEHELGTLTQGKHTLTVRVDNRNVLNSGLGGGHHYYPGMQTIWNGIVGRIELNARPSISMGLVRLFPSYSNSTLGIETTLVNNNQSVAERRLKVTLREKESKRIFARADFTLQAIPGKSVVRHKIKLDESPLPWDEFTPNLYRAEVILGSGKQADYYSCDIGFRDLGTTEYHLTLNGRPMFYRNNHDGCVFPTTAIRLRMSKAGDGY